MSDRVAVVTGAAGGIGSATVQRLREEGMTVVATDLDEASLPDLSEHHFSLDVTDPNDVARVMDAVLAKFGRVDVLVNNAGITGSQQATTAGETPIEEFDRVMAVNVRGPFVCTRALLPAMIDAGGGQVITIASVAGLVAFPRAVCLHHVQGRRADVRALARGRLRAPGHPLQCHLPRHGRDADDPVAARPAGPSRAHRVPGPDRPRGAARRDRRRRRRPGFGAAGVRQRLGHRRRRRVVVMVGAVARS